jgi:sorting nexin-8
VERLKRRIENTSVKLDDIRAALKENWQDEADRLTAMIEKDQATIAAQLSRRVFIRAWCVSYEVDHLTLVNSLSLDSMWHELRVILHNRENALLTQAVQGFAREEHEYAENVANNWMSLSEGVENMPYE